MARRGERATHNGATYEFNGTMWVRIDGANSAETPPLLGDNEMQASLTQQQGAPLGGRASGGLASGGGRAAGALAPAATNPPVAARPATDPQPLPTTLAAPAPTAPVAARPTGPQPQPTTLASPGRVSASTGTAGTSRTTAQSAPTTQTAGTAQSAPVQQSAPAPAAPAPPPRDPWMQPQEGDVLESGGYTFTVVGFRGDGRAILHGSDGLVYIHDPETGNLYETPESAAANPNPRLPQPEPQRPMPQGIDPTAGSHSGAPIEGNRSTLDPAASSGTGGSAATLPQATARWNPETQQWDNAATGQSGSTVGSTQTGASATTQTAGSAATAQTAPTSQGTSIDPRTIPGTPEWVRSVGLGKVWEDYARSDPEGSRRFHGGNAAIQPGVTVPDVGGNIPTPSASAAIPSTETEEQKRRREEEERRRALSGDRSLLTTSSASGLPQFSGGGMMRYAGGGAMPQTMTASSSSLPSMEMGGMDSGMGTEPNAIVGEGEMAPGDHRVELVLIPTNKPGVYEARYAEGPQMTALPEGAIILPQANHTQDLVRSEFLPLKSYPLKGAGGGVVADNSAPGDPAASGLPEYAAGGRTNSAGVLPQSLGGSYPGTNLPTYPQGGPWAGITPQPAAGNLNQIAGMTPMGQTRLDQQYKSQRLLGGLEDQIALFRKSAPGTGSFSTRG